MDRFEEFVEKNVYEFSPMMPPRRDSKEVFEPYKTVRLSFDKFEDFLIDLIKNPILIPISLTIYDVGQNINEVDNLRRIRLLRTLNCLKIKNISFVLSDSTLPFYNGVMNAIGWQHADKTSLEMKIDRNPALISGRDLKLEKAKGSLNMTEEQLLWQPDFVLEQLIGKVDKRVLHDTNLLRIFVRDYFEKLDKIFYTDYLTDFDKMWIAYDFVRRNISYAGECTFKDDNGNTRLKRSDTSWESQPYGTLKHRRGVCTGQAKLLRILLNNYFNGLDSTTICGDYRVKRHNGDKVELHCWGGTVINGGLYQYCTTMGRFLTPLSIGDISYIPDADQMYSKIYPTRTLSLEQVSNIESHVRRLRKKS